MGINDIFDSSKADFSPILGEGDNRAAIGEIKHKVKFDMDETGVEGAAVTASILTRLSRFSTSWLKTCLVVPFRSRNQLELSDHSTSLSQTGAISARRQITKVKPQLGLKIRNTIACCSKLLFDKRC